MENLIDICKKFDIVGSPISLEKCGQGHINQTYLLKTDKGIKYIFQKINTNVFKDVESLMNNIAGVTSFIAKKTTDKRQLTLIPTTDNKKYTVIDGGAYRMYNFISDAVSPEIITDKEVFRIAGEGFGNFQNLLKGYPASELKETIPHFHDTESRYEAFEESIKNDIKGRLKDCKDEVEFYKKRKWYASVVTKKIASGEMPLRVTHNDTKLNNVMIDLKAQKPVAVIDLDTVMPGSIVYDFGDSIRFGANTGAEDEKDLSKVNFSIEYFEAYCRGFLPKVAHCLTQTEIDNMAFGAILMTYECGMRFLTDYLNGDTYFRISRPEHNLDRTRTQIKMIVGMEAELDEMNKIVKKYIVKE